LVFSNKSQAQTCSANYNNPRQWGTHANWFFGDGLMATFPGGTGPISITNIGTDLGNRVAYEGTTAISDNAGTLQYFSNGRSLWNSAYTKLYGNLNAGNESGSSPGNPGGSTSSAVQGVLFVRHPLNPNQIHVFTTDDALTSTDMGLNHSVLDAVSGVMTNPVRLKDDLGNDYRTTEQIDATLHSNGMDIWVVVRQSGKASTSQFRNFYSYLVTCNGLTTVPVKSNQVAPEYGHRWDFGAQPLTTDAWDQNFERGAIKFNWNGTRAATVNDMVGSQDADESIMIFDFDKSTGLLSNCKPVARQEGQWFWSGADYSKQYDCEWAPDGNGLYIAPAAGAPGRILWMDGSLATSAALYASIKVASNTASGACNINLGGDGKLYQATTTNNLNVYTFASTADLNSGTGAVHSSLALPQPSGRGLGSMYIPPVDYLDIQTPIAMDCNDPAVNLSVNWFCKGGSAEDPVGNPTGWSATCGACITDAANGVFNPVIAGQGTHTVYYSYGAFCSISDSLTITVGPCGGCLDTTLAASIPAVCSSNGTINLSLYQGTAAAGSWSIVSGGGTANITGGNTFNINNTPAGTYVVQYTVAGQLGGCGNNPQRSIVVNRPNVTLTLTDNAACVNESAFNLSGGSPVGGTYSGTGVGVSPSFDPGVAGVGPHTITYSYTDGNSCTATATATMTVNALTPVSLNLPDDQICINEGTMNLSGGSPVGGTYSGTGIAVSPTFNPIAAGLGPHTITYTHTDGNGCVNTATDVITVNDTSVVTLVLTDDAACVSEGAFNLSGGSPVGGTYSGTGVGVSPSFNPGTAGVGPHTITYTYSNANSCTTSATDVITVNALPVVTFNLTDTAACIDESSFALGGGNPVGGTYSGVGITVSPTFDPANAGGAGKKQITYTYADGNGCVSSATDSITVNALPVVTLNLAKDAACINEGTFALSGGSPVGGTYSGTGITVSPTFDPVTAGLGSKTITYTYTDGNGCVNTATDALTVNDTATVTLVFADTAVCIDEAPFALSGGSPTPGTYSGTGVNAGNFDPSTGAGKYFITYSHTNASGCTTSAMDTIVVNPLPVVTLVLGDASACINETAFALSGGSPVGGTYSGTGVSGGNFDPTNPGGTGPKTITYTYIDPVTGCQDDATATLTVNALPVVSLADTNVCPGGNIILFPSPNNWASHSWSTGSTNDTIHYNIPNTSVWVDVTDVNGCVNRATANIALGDTLYVDFGAPKEICQNQSVTLNAAAYGPFQAPVIYDWDDLNGVEPSSRVITQAGFYGVRVMDGRGCEGSDTVAVVVHNLPQVNLGKDTTVCFTGKEVFVKYLPDTFATVLWSNNTTDTMTTVYNTGTLSVLVTNQFGCVAGDTINIGEHCEPTVLCVPNVVTPNGDGQNDNFKPCKEIFKYIPDGEYKSIMDNILEVNFTVYDRWGLKMFQSENVFPEWDATFNGTKVADGVYYWIINYTDSSHKKYELTGWVQVID